MDEFDEKMKKFFGDFKEQFSVEEGMATKLMERIKARNGAIRKRKILMFTVVLTLSFLIAMSSIVPVFGKNGTLPQLISGISLEKSATTFSGTIETQPEILNQLKVNGLSTSDSIIILAILDKTSIPVEKIIEMRLNGMGWGKILADLGISLNTVQQTLVQASTQVKDQVKTQENNQVRTGAQEQIKEQNKGSQTNQEQAGNNNQGTSVATLNTALVIKGDIKSIVGNVVTVNETPITVTDQTIIKDTSKLLQFVDLKVGEEILVHAVKDNNVITAQTIQLFNDNSQDKENDVKNFFVINGTVKNITSNPNTLTIENTVVKVTEDTDIKSQGKKFDFASIKIGYRVIAKVHSSASENIADEITVTGNNGNEGQENKENVQTKEYELRSTVVSFDGTILRIKDFENDIIVNQDTKIEKEGLGKVNITAIKTNDTLQIHIRFDGDKYYATNIIVLTAPEHKNETFKGELSVIDLTNEVIFLKDNNLTFKVTGFTKSNKDLTTFQVGDKVEIVGTKTDANTVEIQNINLIKNDKETPGNSGNNPGQGGKH